MFVLPHHKSGHVHLNTTNHNARTSTWQLDSLGAQAGDSWLKRLLLGISENFYANAMWRTGAQRFRPTPSEVDSSPFCDDYLWMLTHLCSSVFFHKNTWGQIRRAIDRLLRQKTQNRTKKKKKKNLSYPQSAWKGKKWRKMRHVAGNNKAH